MNTQSYEKIVENLHDGLYIVSPERIITYWNKAAERITGFTAAEVVGHSCAENILTHVDDQGNELCKGMCPLAKTMDDQTSRDAKVFLHHKMGHRVPVAIRTNTLLDDNGEVIGGIELFNDLSNQQASELRIEELKKLAYLDHLTQLANRNYIELEFKQKFTEKRNIDIPFGILFMDIDHFKNFNDTYGHQLGDEILKLVANTFLSNARAFDIFGRWGGEEFVAILRNITQENLSIIGERIRLLVQNSYLMHQNKKINVTISIGATMAKNEDTIETITERADQLLYQSKKSGRNRLSIDSQ